MNDRLERLVQLFSLNINDTDLYAKLLSEFTRFNLTISEIFPLLQPVRDLFHTTFKFLPLSDEALKYNRLFFDYLNQKEYYLHYDFLDCKESAHASRIFYLSDLQYKNHPEIVQNAYIDLGVVSFKNKIRISESKVRFENVSIPLKIISVFFGVGNRQQDLIISATLKTYWMSTFFISDSQFSILKDYP